MNRNGALALLFNALFVVFMLAPLAVVVAVSCPPPGFLEFPPSGGSLRWFRAILDNPEFIASFWTSLYLGTAAATLAALIAVPAALAIGRYHFPGRGLLIGLFMSPLTVPSIVLGISFLRFLTIAGISGTFLGLVACHAIIVMPYVLRLVLAAVVGLDRDAERAAVSLG